MSWASAYHRISDSSSSSYYGHGSEIEAMEEATQNLMSTDIDHVWVRNPQGVIVWEAMAHRYPS